MTTTPNVAQQIDALLSDADMKHYLIQPTTGEIVCTGRNGEPWERLHPDDERDMRTEFGYVCNCELSDTIRREGN